MDDAPTANPLPEPPPPPPPLRTGPALLGLARPYRRQFVWVAVLALLGTAADLAAPLIYRAAVNDIAGLFVEGGEVAEGRKAERAADAADAAVTPEAQDSMDAAAARALANAELARELAAHEPHRPNFVAPRSFEQTFRTLLWSVLLLLAVNLAAHYFQLAADQRTTRLASRIEADVIQNSFMHALRLPVGFYSRRASASVARQIDQLDRISPIVTAAAHGIAPEIVRMAGVLTIMFTQSFRLSLVALVTLPPYIWIVRRSTIRLESGLAGYYEMWEGISARIQDALGAIKTVKLSGAEARETERLQRESGAAYQKYIDRNRLANSYLFWQTAVNYVSQSVLLGYGGYLVLKGELTPGDVVMFVAYLDRLFTPVESLSGVIVSLQEHLASFKRALRLQQAGTPERSGVPLTATRGEIELRNLTFGYAPGRPVLHDVSLRIPAGSVTALVGPSGAGKTTICDLLLKLYEPQSGSIAIDGQDLVDVDPASIRRQIGLVAADGAIFRGTLADNIRYKRPEASDAEVLAAAHSAGLAQALARLPEGLDTEIGERGLGLSVGERQRLQIARVLVSEPLVLVLDEATANLDYATENDIRGALFNLPQRPTTLVIAHRYSMVREAEHVIVLDGGRVAAQGSIAEVSAASPWFARFAAGAQRNAETQRRPR
jgi:ABC-type multidrug transport system fused ATPase/permease subunit